MTHEIPDGRKRGNKTRCKYNVDFSNERLRELSSYGFSENNAQPHSHPGLKSGIIQAAKKKIFVKDIVNKQLLLAVNKSILSWIFSDFDLHMGFKFSRKFWVENETNYKSASIKIARLQGRSQAEPQVVLAEYREIFETDYENLGTPQTSVF